jgi:hypothetical protein
MEFIFWKEFEKEFKKLQKRYLSLKGDLEDFFETLELDPFWESLLSNHIVKISWLWEGIKWNFYKVRKFVCRSIAWNSSNSWIRIIYKYSGKNSIELCEIEFIEIYHKNNKSNHNISRIKNNNSY